MHGSPSGFSATGDSSFPASPPGRWKEGSGAGEKANLGSNVRRTRGRRGTDGPSAYRPDDVVRLEASRHSFLLRTNALCREGSGGKCENLLGAADRKRILEARLFLHPVSAV